MQLNHKYHHSTVQKHTPTPLDPLLKHQRSRNKGLSLVRIDGPSLVDGFADDVDDAAERGRADGDGDGAAGVRARLAADQTLRTVHGDGTDYIFAEMLSHLGEGRERGGRERKDGGREKDESLGACVSNSFLSFFRMGQFTNILVVFDD